MKKRRRLPITQAQRRRIEYRARCDEQNRMIRALRAALRTAGTGERWIIAIVADMLANRRKARR